jgi:hypothetical protein
MKKTLLCIFALTAGMAAAQTTPQYLPLRGGKMTGSLTAPDLIADGTPVYDVRAFGAVAGASDVTSDVQAAVNAAGAVGGTVYFPPGVWNLNGAIQSACDAIICMPSFSDTGHPGQLKIVGATHIRQDANWGGAAGTMGTLIQTTTNTGTDNFSAIFGVPQVAGNFGNFDNLDLYMRDLDFRTYTNPNLGCVNASYSDGFSMVYFRCEVGQAYTGTTKVQPTNIVTGVELPFENNDTLAELRHGEVSGYYIGVGASEHADVEFVTVAYGIYGLSTGLGYHPAHFYHLVSQENGTPVRFVAGSIPVTFDGLDIEYDANNIVCPIGNSWCWSGVDISDPSNYGHGLISYTKVIAGTGTSTASIVLDSSSSGQGLDFYDQTNSRWALHSSGMSQRAALVTGVATANGDGMQPGFDAQFQGIDLILGSDSANANTPALQAYSGGSGNTLGSSYAAYEIQPKGGNTQVGSSGATINLLGTVDVHGTAGFSGTKTAGSCVLTLVQGIITNVTGC